MDLILSDVSLAEIRANILKRKIKKIFILLFSIFIWKPLCLIGRMIASFFRNTYLRLYPKRYNINKIVKTGIILYFIFVVIYNLILYFNNGAINVTTIIVFACLIPGYFIIRKLLYLYHFFIGDYQLNEQGLYDTREYITKYMLKLVKIFGRTGAGKDTFMAGCATTLSDYFKEKTYIDLEEIRDICYIFDFDRLDKAILDNYQDYLSFSKEKILANFIGDSDKPGLALYNNLFLKKHYLKTKELTPEFIVNDYYNFKEDPFNYNTSYAYGIGINRKHYLQMILEEYIEWLIRLNVEDNFILSNQPFIEDINTGIMARQFSFNYLKTKRVVSKKTVIEPGTMKRAKREQVVLFPWKDRLIVTETECGTWYSNKSGETGSEMMEGGIRDFKAYQRHFMSDFYWFQVDQASDRTQKIFRELDHGYAGILSRTEIEGGKKVNLFLNFKLNRYQKKIDKILRKRNRLENAKIKRSQKMEDLQQLLNASNKERYRIKLEKLNKKYRPKPLTDRYYLYQKKISILKNKIKENKKDGYIQLVVCISPSGSMPQDYNVVPMSQIINSDSVPVHFVSKFIFRTRDCERYDTRYLRNLAEAKAQESNIVLAQVKRWASDFKLRKADVAWMGYSAGNDMFGITEEEINNLKYFDGYKEYLEE